MDSNRLRYFLVVFETGSIRRAAELLHMSAAALSKAIKQLEVEAGFKLLVPAGRGIALSDEGKELALKAKPLIEDLAGLSKGLRDRRAHRLKPLIKIGSFEVFTTYFLGPLLRELPADSGLLLREVVPGELERVLLDREIDFGLTFIPIPTNGIEHQQVANIEMGIFGTKAAIIKFSQKPFEEVPFVIPIQPITGSPTKVQGLDGWPDDRVTRLVQHRVTLMESALEICRQGLAVAYFPSFVIGLHNQNVKAPHQLESMAGPKGLGTQRQAVYIARRKSDLEGATFKKLARIIRVTCK
jgi:DNA-binding transcriptional LysR family regulator